MQMYIVHSRVQQRWCREGAEVLRWCRSADAEEVWRSREVQTRWCRGGDAEVVQRFSREGAQVVQSSCRGEGVKKCRCIDAEVQQWVADAEWVVLSGCRGGAGAEVLMQYWCRGEGAGEEMQVQRCRGA